MDNISFENFDYKKSLDGYLNLFKDAFPEVQDNSENGYFWQMQSFPNEDKSYEYIATLDKTMVGYYAAIPYRYNINGSVKIIGMVCGVMTSSKYRGKGIFTKLGTHSLFDLKCHVSFTTGFPIRKEVLPGHLKVGWKVAFELPLYIKFYSLKSLLINKNKKLIIILPIIDRILKIYNYSISKIFKPKKHTILLYNNILEIPNISQFEEKWAKSHTISLIKDISFLNWRYSRPNVNYKYVVLEIDKIIYGFCSYRHVLKEGVPSYAILDLRVENNNQIYVRSILAKIEQEAKKNNIESIFMMIGKKNATKYGLVKNGFLKSPYHFKFIFNNLNHDYSDDFLSREENWHLMWVDSDDL